MKVFDSRGNRLRVGNKVVCIKKSELAPNAIDSQIGRTFTITGIGFVNSTINPGNNIILDCHPIYDYEHDMEYIAAKPKRFLKLCSS